MSLAVDFSRVVAVGNQARFANSSKHEQYRQQSCEGCGCAHEWSQSGSRVGFWVSARGPEKPRNNGSPLKPPLPHTTGGSKSTPANTTGVTWVLSVSITAQGSRAGDFDHSICCISLLTRSQGTLPSSKLHNRITEDGEESCVAALKRGVAQTKVTI